MEKIRIISTTCDRLYNPIGIDTQQPVFNYVVESHSKNAKQHSYRIQIRKEDADFSDVEGFVWDSGEVISSDSIHIPYNGNPLEPKTRYYYHIRVTDNHGNISDYSEPAFFETGMMDNTHWKASWITYDYEESEKLNPCPMFRKLFTVDNEVKKARLYITSRGLYEAYINGKRIGDSYLTPGNTSFHNRLQYQVYDVTSYIEKNNTTTTILGDGWYRGICSNETYGQRLYLLYQLEIEYIDGSIDIIASDDSFQSAKSSILMSDFYLGEKIDTIKWRDVHSLRNTFKWYNVRCHDFGYDNIIHTISPNVKEMMHLTPIEKIITPKGELVFDLGQNMVGWIQIKIKGEYGNKIIIEHAEVLDQEGNFYVDNLRMASQKTEYILNGDEQILKPHFSFQGFRYIRITCNESKVNLLTHTIQKEDIQGIVLYSSNAMNGSFECSHPLINQLQKNIQWGQRGNFIDIPTDCPQRDERYGWTGDAQVFMDTAVFNMDIHKFFEKWLGDLKADQCHTGAVTYVVPNTRGLDKKGATGWGDASTICPYIVYLSYGDKNILRKQYDSMKAWVDFCVDSMDNDYIWRKGFHYGDWLAKDWPTDLPTNYGATTTHLIATAFTACSIEILVKAAKILGMDEESEHYQKIYNNIRQAFNNEFVSPSGRIASDTQTSYVLPLAFNLLDEDMAIKAVKRLVQDIKSRNNHLSTGFLGTPYLCHVLSEYGYNEVAYDLLFQETCPSWLYPIIKGATTIWERWDGIREDNSFQSPSMNSFNHYAYGAIGSWLYQKVAGINYCENQPGYKHIYFKPLPDSRLEYVKCYHDSIHGKVGIEWILDKGKYEVKLVVPFNTTATFITPFKDKTMIFNDCEIDSESVQMGSGIHKLVIML